MCLYVGCMPCMCRCQRSEEDSWSPGTRVTCLVSCPVCILGTNLWFSERAANKSLSLWAILPASKHTHTCPNLEQWSHGLYSSLLILHPKPLVLQFSAPKCNRLLILYYFTNVGVLPAYMFVHHMCIVLTEARRWYQSPWNCSYKWLWTTCGC